MDKVYSVVKRIRVERGVTQLQMANNLHIVVSAYGKMERGDIKLTVERLREIAEYFKLPFNYFVSPDTKGFEAD